MWYFSMFWYFTLTIVLVPNWPLLKVLFTQKLFLKFGSFEIPDPMEEDSMEEDLPGVIVPDFQPQAVEYQVVESSTQRGRKKLVDSLGHSYTVKRRYDDENAVWRCCIRNKTTSCLATVRQRGTDFIPGPQTHCHQPAVGSLAAVRITSSVKEKAMKDFYQPAGMIVQEVLLEQLDSAPCPAMPKEANLIRQVNRRRQKSRPVEPNDLEFELNPEHIPGGFLQADIKVGNEWHLVFSTEQMLTLLARSKQWYVMANIVY